MSRGTYDREGSHSSTRSYGDYDTDEVRRRWRLSTPPRAKSLTREEAREIIDRQSIDDNYTGYTYGDSISYRSDGNTEYLHPYLSGRKYIDFGSGGDVTSYRPASIRHQRRKKPFYVDALEWAKLNGVDSLTSASKWIFKGFLFVIQIIAAFGMLLGSFVNLAYQKVAGSLSRKSTIRSPTLVSPGKRTRSPRSRMHVSFSSPVDDTLSFRQTSTPLASAPAIQTLQQSSYVPSLHVYVWLFVHRVWEITSTAIRYTWETLTNVVNQVGGNSSSIFYNTWNATKSVFYRALELLIAAFTYIFQYVSHAYTWISDLISNRFSSLDHQTPRRRGRPPKTPRVQHSGLLSPLKTTLDNGTEWTMNKLEKAGEGLAYLSWSAFNGATNTVSYIQNNYASAQKSRNWWPLILLFLMLLSLGLYGYQNKQHGRNLTTALYQDSLYVRQWAAEARDSLPSPLNLFKNVGDFAKQTASNIGSFLFGIFQAIRQGLVNFFNLLPTPWKLLGTAAEQVKHLFSALFNFVSNVTSTVLNFFANIASTAGKFFTDAISTAANFSVKVASTAGNFFTDVISAVVNFFSNVFESIRQGFWNAYSYLPSPSSSISAATEQTKKFFSNFVTFFTGITSDIANFVAHLFSNIVNFITNVFKSIFHWFSNALSYVPSPSNIVNGTSNGVQWIGSSIVDFFFNIYETVRHGFWSAYSYLPTPSKIFGGTADYVKNIFSTIGNFFSNIFESLRHSFWNAYSYVPSPWNAYEVVSKPVYQFFSYVNVIIIDVLRSISNWVYRPSVAVVPTSPGEVKVQERIIERVIEKPVGLNMSEVERLIEERISKYDADKTGQPDYALESSGGSVVGIGCTEVYEETSRLQSIFGIPLYFSNYSPRTVIQRRANSPTAGECWPYVGGHGELFIKLSHKINVTSVSYEHLSPRLSPERHMKTAPKEFRVWSIHNYKEKDERKHLLGDYVYVDGGEALQSFDTQFPDEESTEVLGLETFTNHGSPVTCLYRFRVHGQPVKAEQE